MFALCQKLMIGSSNPGGPTLMATDDVQERREAGDGDPKKQRYNEVTIKHAKVVKKRTGAARWTHKLAKSLERYLKGMRDLPEGPSVLGSPELELHAALGDDLAMDMLRIILDCDDPSRKILKDTPKHKRKKEKQRNKTCPNEPTQGGL